MLFSAGTFALCFLVESVLNLTTLGDIDSNYGAAVVFSAIVYAVDLLAAFSLLMLFRKGVTRLREDSRGSVSGSTGSQKGSHKANSSRDLLRQGSGKINSRDNSRGSGIEMQKTSSSSNVRSQTGSVNKKPGANRHSKASRSSLTPGELAHEGKAGSSTSGNIELEDVQPVVSTVPATAVVVDNQSISTEGQPATIAQTDTTTAVVVEGTPSPSQSAEAQTTAAAEAPVVAVEAIKPRPAVKPALPKKESKYGKSASKLPAVAAPVSVSAAAAVVETDTSATDTKEPGLSELAQLFSQLGIAEYTASFEKQKLTVGLLKDLTPEELREVIPEV